MLHSWIPVWVVLVFVAAFVRLLVAAATAAAKKKDDRKETGKAKTERRSGARRFTKSKPAATFTAQDADAAGPALAQDRIASGLPEWQQYYGVATDWE